MENLENKLTLEERINNVISDSFIGVMAFIFLYDKNGVNTKIFKDYLGLDIENLSSGEEFVKKAFSKLQEKKKEFFELKKEIESELGEELGERKKYYIKNFEQIALFFDNFENYIKIELEKIKYFDYEIESEEKQQILSEIEEKEKQIFGPKISEDLEYRSLAFGEINRLFLQNRENLNEEEKIFLEKMLGELEDKYTFKDIEKKEKGEKKEGVINLEDELSKENDEILNIKISREDYVRIMELSLNILGLKQKVEISKLAKNVNVTNEKINIPNIKNYEKLTLRRIIELISHEIEGHMIANTNNLEQIGNLRSISYIAKEEGMAYTFEKLASGIDLESIPVNRHFYRVFIGENYGGEDFRKFLEIINKLDGETLNVDDYILRYKRGKDINLPGVNPKDKLYGIGAIQVKNLIQNGENPLGLFLAKHSFKDQEMINNLVGNGEKLTPELFRAKQMVLPLLVGELIRYKVLNPEEKDKGLLGGFFKHVSKRYGKLFESLGISYKDFVKAYILDTKEQKKKAFNEIMDIIEKYTKTS